MFKNIRGFEEQEGSEVKGRDIGGTREFKVKSFYGDEKCSKASTRIKVASHHCDDGANVESKDYYLFTLQLSSGLSKVEPLRQNST